MKKLVLTTATAGLLVGGAFTTAAQAQAIKSEVSIFTNIDSSSSSTSGSSGSTDTTISSLFGQYGYYFTPQLVGTIGLGFTGVTTKTTGSPQTSATTFVMDLGAKYYFGGFQKGAFVPFVNARLEATSTYAESGGSSTTLTGGGIAGGGGFSYFFTEATSFDGQVNLYTRSISSDVAGSPSSTQNGVVFQLGLTTRF